MIILIVFQQNLLIFAQINALSQKHMMKYLDLKKKKRLGPRKKLKKDNDPTATHATTRERHPVVSPVPATDVHHRATLGSRTGISLSAEDVAFFYL